MYCPKCGTQNDDNAYKCTTCGIILQQVSPEKKSNTVVIVVVVVAVAVMVFFAVAGILAAIAIPAYLDYSTKAKIAEVANAFDVLAEATAKYHADTGQFPEQNYSPYNLVAVPQTYGAFSCPSRAHDDDITYRFTFNNTISHLNDCTLDMEITYASDTGYSKQWLSTSTLPAKYMPQR